jgi:Ni/Fe-hydrogenase subunit HybB-like protein
VPLFLVWRPRAAATRGALAAPLLVIAGAFALLYVFIIGGQAYPLELFPGLATTSSFGDGQVRFYAPSLPEVVLGIGGLGVAFLITLVGVRVFDFLPHDEVATPRAAD